MKRKTWRLIAIILCSVICLGCIAGGMGLIKVDDDKVEETFARKVNENNLYTVDCCELEDTNDGSGIVIDVDERTGAITVSGTADESAEYVVGTVVLDKGTYTFTAVKGGTISTIYMTATNGSEVIKADFTGNQIVIETDGTEVVLTLHIAGEKEFNNKDVLPVIVPGEKSGDFWK